MFGGDRDDLTICAVATPFGTGGISVIRVSGPEALSITRKIAEFIPQKPESHRSYFGTLNSANDGEIDEVLCAYFAKGKSFTGEETIEISCHGNPLICEIILRALQDSGATTALPGEFTYRAFINGKIDLTQAESVLSLIHSHSARASKVSLRHLKGDLSKNIESLESEMLWILAHSEAQIDFSTDAVDAASESVIEQRLTELAQKVDLLAKSYGSGRIINEGLRIALVGKPNAGKSSLYNFIAQREKAIVSDIPGTTRDVLETSIGYRGAQFNFLDTAGLRTNVEDSIEKIGIERTVAEIKDADVILWLHDLTEPFQTPHFAHPPSASLIVVGTKRDLLSGSAERAAEEAIERAMQEKAVSGTIFISVKKDQDRQALLDLLYEKFFPSMTDSGIYIVHQRQAEHMKEIQAALKTALESIQTGVGYEFVSADLKRALIALQNLLGKVFDDQILDKVFKEFCIGK